MSTTRMRDVLMQWPDADPNMHPRFMMRAATRAMAQYAAARGLNLVSAPHLSRETGVLTGRAHTRPAGRLSWRPETDTDPKRPPMPACARHTHPGMWTSDDQVDQRHAAAVCKAKCPLIESCLTGALARKEVHHVWGGELFPLPRRQTARATVA